MAEAKKTAAKKTTESAESEAMQNDPTSGVPVERSGLNSIHQDVLNPAFAGPAFQGAKEGESEGDA